MSQRYEDGGRHALDLGGGDDVDNGGGGDESLVLLPDKDLTIDAGAPRGVFTIAFRTELTGVGTPRVGSGRRWV